MKIVFFFVFICNNTYAQIRIPDSGGEFELKNLLGLALIGIVYYYFFYKPKKNSKSTKSKR